MARSRWIDRSRLDRYGVARACVAKFFGRTKRQAARRLREAVGDNHDIVLAYCLDDQAFCYLDVVEAA